MRDSLVAPDRLSKEDILRCPSEIALREFLASFVSDKTAEQLIGWELKWITQRVCLSQNP